jgi:hypothetical protein
MKLNISRRSGARASAGLVTALLVGCSTWITPGDPDLTKLDGHVVVKWIGSDSREDRYIYQKQGKNPLRFRASFMTTDIVPETMYTTGGSIPRVFWSIPGLSPWGLAPAYIIHEWIIEVHRCRRFGYPEVATITFEQSAQILAEVGQELIDVGLIKTDKLDEIVWGVRTWYARRLWDQPGTENECKEPGARAMAAAKPFVDFKIPRGRRLTTTEITQLQTGCTRVFRAPTQYSQETVAICRIVTSL